MFLLAPIRYFKKKQNPTKINFTKKDNLADRVKSNNSFTTKIKQQITKCIMFLCCIK